MTDPKLGRERRRFKTTKAQAKHFSQLRCCVAYRGAPGTLRRRRYCFFFFAGAYPHFSHLMLTLTTSSGLPFAVVMVVTKRHFFPLSVHRGIGFFGAGGTLVLGLPRGFEDFGARGTLVLGLPRRLFVFL